MFFPVNNFIHKSYKLCNIIYPHIYTQDKYDESLKSDFLGMAATLIPFSENNPGIRNTFTCMVC